VEGYFDVVVGATVTSFPACDLARRLGLPYLVRLGESEPLRTVVKWLYGGLDPEVEIRARLAFEGAFAFVSVSHEAVRRYRADGVEARYVVLSTGVDVKRARAYRATSGREQSRRELGIDADQRVMICAGAIWKVKGQAALVSALAQLHELHPELICLLVGNAEPSYVEAFTAFLDAHGMSDAVRVLPHCEDLRPLWRAADVAACPSESEAFPAAVLEAMSYGLPVLGAEVGDIPFMVTPGVNGWLFRPSDLASLLAQLSLVASASDRRLHEMGQASRRIAARYDHRTNLERWSDLLRCAANGTAPTWQGDFKGLHRRRWPVRRRGG
jgi:glycosyltransferase involved in cell wall biosynthesis